MSEHPNIARGEQEIELDGETFILAATFDGIAKLQGALGVKGLAEVTRLILTLDPVVFKECVNCLAISGDPKKVGKSPFRQSALLKLKDAILLTFLEPEEDAKNADGVTVKLSLK